MRHRQKQLRVNFYYYLMLRRQIKNKMVIHKAHEVHKEDLYKRTLR